MDAGNYYVKDKDDKWTILTVENDGRTYLRAKMFAPQAILDIHGIDLDTAIQIHEPDK